MVALFAVLTLSATTTSLVAPVSALATSSQPSAAAEQPLAGTQVTLGRGGTKTAGELSAHDRNAPPAVASAAIPRPKQPSRANLAANPESSKLTGSAFSQAASKTSSPPKLPQALGTQFLGTQLSEANAIPPDSMGAVGPSQFVVIVNGRIKTFNKSTGVADGVLNATTNTFFSLFANGWSTSDPHVRYDRLSRRWFFTMVNILDLSTSNRVLTAFSDSGVITGGTTFTYNFYNVATLHPGCIWDYDTLGIDQTALYVGGNIFCPSYESSNGLVMSKANLLGGVPTAYDFKFVNAVQVGCGAGDGPFAPQGVDNYDPASSVGYFAGVSACLFGKLFFVRITNPGGAPPSAALLALTVPSTYAPAPVPAMGSTHPLDATDDRLFAAHLRNGHLWTAHNICVDVTGAAYAGPGICPGTTRDAARWYDITNLGTAPALNQSGTVFDNTVSNPRFYSIPSIMVSGQGHVAMGTTVAGAAEHAEAATMGRLAGDASGSMQAANVYQTSTFAYNAQPSPPPPGTQRWGDYSYTSLDPNDDMTMWTIQEFANATDSWGVEAVQLKAPPPATPSTTDGTVINTNQCSQTFTVTGTSSGGSGFYDPGAGFANRIQASSSGGVTVNKVTYIDPTHIAVDISTQGAAAGSKDLTVTNPDGQSVTAAGFFSVGGPSAQPDTETAASLNQYSLTSSDGATWQEIDPYLRIACTPAANQSTLLTANADLWTGSAGFNQDMGIFLSDNGGADSLLAWKESGGFAGTSSPNAAYVQSVYPMVSGHSYVFKLKWKTNKNAPGAFIAAGAGVPGNHSPTSLVAETFPTGTAPNFVKSLLTSQYSLSNSDGTTWTLIDNANLSTSLSPGANSTAVLGANSDLWTGNAGFNQDLAIFVSDTRSFADGSTANGSTAITSGGLAQFTAADIGGSITGSGIPASTTVIAVADSTHATISQNATLTASGVSMTITSADTLVAWKESGGFAGTSSPNAAFVKATYPMIGTHTYNFMLKWKTNKNAPGTFIAAGAGLPGNFSPTSLVVQTIASGPNPYHAEMNSQYSLSNSDGATWQPIDAALNVTVAPGSGTKSILGANADLWTGNAGFNQDLGIFVSDNGGADTLLAWKESGGFAGTSSPNAAFAQATYTMTAGHTYVFKLKWKTNKNAPGTFIAAGAGVLGNFSPTRLTVELTN